MESCAPLMAAEHLERFADRMTAMTAARSLVLMTIAVPLRRAWPLRQKFLDHMTCDIGQPIVSACMAVG